MAEHGVLPTHYYCGRVRPDWRGWQCRIVQTWRGKGKHSVLIEFTEGPQIGRRAIVPIRCVRKLVGNAVQG